MKIGTLIKIKQAKKISNIGNLFENKLAIWLKSGIIHKTRWHHIVLCHNNKEETVYNLKAEVINESKSNET
jgi:hypothetical protein|tara:strand:- start:814 stop:1026 length:213 start_codon:yes stop_codon:yes gene_type:complete